MGASARRRPLLATMPQTKESTVNAQTALAYIEAWLVVNSEGADLARLARMFNESVKSGIIFA